ncbi:type IV secretion protein Dot [Legionella sp. km772]|uniref:type IV secretion protein Dot n=1 Tax=Legionella sp. km772 TaxID=2498111 RepID=UPI000F8E7CC3|nr:type IV secretion protein Dot [Legionella sp. km772]RUR13364.1 type IV secretion protein Dot [Legionella sp. km772]
MRFILAPNTIINLDFLRDKYQKAKDIDLSTPPSLFSMPTFLGGVDYKARKAQIEFLEKIRVILKPNTFKEEEITKLEELQASLTASRVMIAATLYIKHQISETYKLRHPKGKSVLYSLIDEDLGINAQNYLDEEDEEVCILAAKRIMMSSISALDDANEKLREAGLKGFTEKEWSDFHGFLSSRTISKVTKDPYANYPITNITQKLFGAAGAYTGATVGYISGDVMSHSTKALSTKTKFTALIGSTLLVFGSAGPAGVALFAPAIAERLISAFCSISLAHILGVSMGLLGQGLGIVVGVPLDLAYKLIWTAAATVGTYSFSSKKPLLTGIRLADGMTVFCGVPLEATPTDKLPADYKQVLVDVRDGQLYINDKLVNVPETGKKLPEEVLKILEARLKDTPVTGDEEGVELDEIDSLEPEVTGNEKIALLS